MMSRRKLRIASRDSQLAVVQARLLMAAIQACDPGIELELITMKTTGDLILDQSLDKIGGKGLFVKELDRALLEGRADLTVHSLKDMPMLTDPELPIVAVSRREDPRDVLILPEGCTQLDLSLPIGCSSVRRRTQLRSILPDMTSAPVRGNVLTRLNKLDRGEFGALVLAAAGIRRLGLEHRISRTFSTTEIIPAGGQGILAVQARQDFDPACLATFHDPLAWDVAMAERSFIRTLDGGCSLPMAAYAEMNADQLTLTGFYHPEEQDKSFWVQVSGTRHEAEQLGEDAARQIFALLRKDGIG